MDRSARTPQRKPARKTICCTNLSAKTRVAR
jgi:hypothetical protein